MRRYLTRNRGFTLVEMLVTMAVMAIILTIAALGFKDVIFRNQVRAAANDFVGALSFARSEAVSRGAIVTLCPSNDGQTCSGVQFDRGWLVVLDEGGANQEILRIYPPRPGLLVEREDGGGNVKIRYAPTGFLQQGSASGDILIQGIDQDPLFVFVGQTGRVKTTRTPYGGG